MINANNIADISDSQDLRAFSVFVIDMIAAAEPYLVDINDFMSVADLMDRVFIIDVVPRGRRKLLFRYSGSSLDAQYDMNLMGRYFEDVYQGSNRSTVVGNLLNAVKYNRVGYLRQRVTIDQHGLKRRLVERVAFPLSRDGQTVDQLCGIVTFIPITDYSPEDKAIVI